LLALGIIVGVAVPNVAVAEDSVEAARQRILKAAIEKALKESETLPPLTEKNFIDWWRPAIGRLTTDTCKCDFGDKTCARLAMDEFQVDMMGVFFRLKGVRDAVLKSENPRQTGQEVSTGILNRHVPAKEQLRVQAKLEVCVSHATGIRYNHQR
jgi:hypothetical protein